MNIINDLLIKQDYTLDLLLESDVHKFIGVAMNYLARLIESRRHYGVDSHQAIVSRYTVEPLKNEYSWGTVYSQLQSPEDINELELIVNINVTKAQLNQLFSDTHLEERIKKQGIGNNSNLKYMIHNIVANVGNRGSTYKTINDGNPYFYLQLDLTVSIESLWKEQFAKDLFKINQAAKGFYYLKK